MDYNECLTSFTCMFLSIASTAGAPSITVVGAIRARVFLWRTQQDINENQRS